MTVRHVDLPVLHCYRCVYSWRPRLPSVRICPRCKSPHWDVPVIRPLRLGRGLGIEDVVAPHRSAIHRLMRKYGAKDLRVFGSIRRSEGRAHSDLDLLVTWGPGRKPLAWLRLPIELEDVLGRRVDLVSPEALHWAVRPQVEAEAVPV